MSKFFVTLCLFLLAQVAWAEALLDPTRPYNYSPNIGGSGVIVEGKQQITLTATIVGKKRHVAIINGQSAQVGDTIDGYKIMEIKKDSVRVLGPSGTIDLTISPEVKTPVSSSSE